MRNTSYLAPPGRSRRGLYGTISDAEREPLGFMVCSKEELLETYRRTSEVLLRTEPRSRSRGVEGLDRALRIPRKLLTRTSREPRWVVLGPGAARPSIGLGFVWRDGVGGNPLAPCPPGARVFVWNV